MTLKELYGKTLINDHEVEWIQVDEKVKRKIMAYDESMMLVKVAFQTGGIGAMHHHPHLQISYVASGVFEVTISGESKVLKEGDVYYVPANAVHGAICMEEGVLIDVFSPMREDFL